MFFFTYRYSQDFKFWKRPCWQI